MMRLRQLLFNYAPARLEQEPREQQIVDKLNEISTEAKIDYTGWAKRIRMIRKEHSEVEIFDWEAWTKKAIEDDRMF